MPNIRIGDFFCGVGDIRLGFERESEIFQTVFSNDINEKAIETYKLNFPDFKVCNKPIEKLTEKDIPDFDIFCGGFPCQPFSIAGKMGGFNDTRGNLFFEIIRILRFKKPKIVFLENVKNIVSHDSGKTFQKIKSELEACGYYIKYKILDTCKYGNIPHHRERVFIIGFLDKDKYEKFNFPEKIPLTNSIISFLEKDVDKKYYYSEKSKIYPELKKYVVNHIRSGQVYQWRRKYVRENKSGVCFCQTSNMGTGGHNVSIILDDIGIRKLTPRECFNLQGFGKKFRLPKISDSALYCQSGNSVSVRVIKRLAESILESITI
jgi:DNA (cytosine-5)-methyltransferase 1